MSCFSALISLGDVLLRKIFIHSNFVLMWLWFACSQLFVAAVTDVTTTNVVVLGGVLRDSAHKTALSGQVEVSFKLSISTFV